MRNLGLIVLLGAVLLLQINATRLADWLARTLGRQHPDRPERREEEWLGALSELPLGWPRLIHALGYVSAMLRAQREPVWMIILGLFVSVTRLAARAVFLPLIALSPYQMTVAILEGRAHWTDLPVLLFVLSNLVFGMQTDSSDFRWMPRIAYPDKVKVAILLVHLLGIFGMITVGHGIWRWMGVAIVACYLLMFWNTIRTVYQARRAR
jgi:hypothetical protein